MNTGMYHKWTADNGNLDFKDFPLIIYQFKIITVILRICIMHLDLVFTNTP